MEEENREWLMGQNVSFPTHPYNIMPRPFEEVSAPGEISDVIGETGDNGESVEDGNDGNDGDDGDGSDDGDDCHSGMDGYGGVNDHGSVNGSSVENGQNGENSQNGDNSQNGEDDTHAKPTTNVLPGCSKGKDHKQPWHMSIYHMQAYLLMKGPGGPDDDDPMLLWMAEQDKKKAIKAAEMAGNDDETGHEPNEPGMFTSAKASMKMDFDWKTKGPAKYDEEDDARPTSYKYPRPKIDHLGLPPMLDPKVVADMYQAHKKAGGGWSEFVNDYCSDDEGDFANGRISPCTFLRFSEGAGEKKYGSFGDRFKSVTEPRQEFEIPEDRQRPKSPNTVEPRAPKHRSKKPQKDECDGTSMSPICSEYGDTQPSILWSPPPMKATMATIPKSVQKQQMFRMDPELAIALREGHKDVVLGSDHPFGVDEPDERNDTALVTQMQKMQFEDVTAVVSKYWDVEETFGTMAQTQRDLAHLAHNEHMVNTANEQFQHTATALKHENRRLTDCVRQQRHAHEMRVMRRVDGQLRELEYERRTRLAEVEAQYRANEALRRQVERERAVQAELLAEFGKQTPEEVFAMFPDVWEPLEKRKNYRNYS